MQVTYYPVNSSAKPEVIINAAYDPVSKTSRPQRQSLEVPLDIRPGDQIDFVVDPRRNHDCDGLYIVEAKIWPPLEGQQRHKKLVLNGWWNAPYLPWWLSAHWCKLDIGNFTLERRPLEGSISAVHFFAFPYSNSNFRGWETQNPWCKYIGHSRQMSPSAWMPGLWAQSDLDSNRLGK